MCACIHMWEVYRSENTVVRKLFSKSGPNVEESMHVLEQIATVVTAEEIIVISWKGLKFRPC